MSQEHPHQQQQQQLTPRRVASAAEKGTPKRTKNSHNNSSSNSPDGALKPSTNRVNNSNTANSNISSRHKLSKAVQKRRKQNRLLGPAARASFPALSASLSSSFASEDAGDAATTRKPKAAPIAAATLEEEKKEDDSVSPSAITKVSVATAKDDDSATCATFATPLSPVSSAPTPRASGSGNQHDTNNSSPELGPLPEHPSLAEAVSSCDESLVRTSQTWAPNSAKSSNDEDDDLLLHQAYEDLFPSASMNMASMTATPKASRQTRNPEPQTIQTARQAMQQQQQQQQRKLQQIQQDHYQNKVATPTNTTTSSSAIQESTKSPQEQRTFQEQYMEQQAALDRQSSKPSRRGTTGAGSDEEDEEENVNLPQAKLVGAATAMSSGITFAMNKFQELLQPNPKESSRLLYSATSESFTSSLAAEEKKESGDYDDYEAGCTSIYPRRYSKKDRDRRHKSRRASRDLRLAPSAVSAGSESLQSGISSVTGATSTQPPPPNSTFTSLVNDISPMMRMRNPESQHAVEIAASSSSHTQESSVAQPPPPPPQKADSQQDILTTSSTSYKTEEQVKAEKQRKWKHKMKLAQQQQKQEQAELGDDVQQQIKSTPTASYSYSIDEDDETYRTYPDDDDTSVVSFGCRPGSNLVEIFSTLSGIPVETSKGSNKSTASSKTGINPNNPVEVLQKVLSARCGVELASSSDEEEDDGYSYSDGEESERRRRRRRRRRKEEQRKKNRRRNKDLDDDEEEESDQESKRGRSRRPRPSSPNSRTRGTSVHSQVSRHSETSLGEILDENVAATSKQGDGARAERDRLELHLLKSKQDFRILGTHTHGRAGDTTVMSGGSSATPVAGTASANVSIATASVNSEFKLDPPVTDSSVGGPVVSSSASVVSDSPSKGGPKNTTSLRSVKSVSFDESTISKPAEDAVNVPTITSLDRSDPNFIKKFVSCLSQTGTPLLWHRTPAQAPASSSASAARPEPVTAYLRLQANKSYQKHDGFGVDTAQPSQTFQSTDPDSPQLVWRREIISGEGHLEEEMGHVDLFDIASFETASSMSASFLKALEDFPFSMPSRTLVIQLNRPTKHSLHPTNQEWPFPSGTKQSSPANMIVLEATSDEAATTLVLGMKWMVARLAFNLIVGNTSISCELYRKEQQAEDRLSNTGGDEDSMGPRRPPIFRKTKVMNAVTFHMLGKVAEKTNQYQLEQTQQQSGMFAL